MFLSLTLGYSTAVQKKNQTGGIEVEDMKFPGVSKK